MATTTYGTTNNTTRTNSAIYWAIGIALVALIAFFVMRNSPTDTVPATGTATDATMGTTTETGTATDTDAGARMGTTDTGTTDTGTATDTGTGTGTGTTADPNMGSGQTGPDTNPQTGGQ